MAIRTTGPHRLAAALLISLACGPLAPAVAPSPTSIPTRPGSPASATATPRPLISTPSSTPGPPPVQGLPAAPPRFRPGDPVVLRQVHMVDALAGWGLAGVSVLTTRDGGLTWHEFSPPPSAGVSERAEAQALFFDADHAWVVIADDGRLPSPVVVWRTSDGGRTWSPSDEVQPEVIGETTWVEFAAADLTRLWLMARGVYLGAGTHYSHQLFVSLDGGVTWGPRAADTYDDYTGMLFRPDGSGLLTWQTIGAYAEGPPDYALTDDGGENWEKRSLPPPPQQPDAFRSYPYCEPYQPVMLSALQIRLLVGCRAYQGSPLGSAGFHYASDDGGRTWRISDLPVAADAAGSQLFHFDTHALLLGRQIFHSSDDGQTWQFVKTVFWDGAFTFVDRRLGWAVATNDGEVALVQTDDGGARWTEIRPTIGGG